MHLCPVSSITVLQRATECLQDRHAEEHAVAAVYSRAAPCESGLPLRLLNNFFLFVRDPVTGAEQPAGLEDLHNGQLRQLGISSCCRRG
jgi:hypothetical protein